MTHIPTPTRFIPLLFLAFAAGCEGEPADATETPTTATESSDRLTVAVNGSRYDPAVTSDQIPAGAWMCDMNGSVHYAALDPADAECPVCGMDLVQKSEAPDGREMGDGHEMGDSHDGHEMSDSHDGHEMGDRHEHGMAHGR